MRRHIGVLAVLPLLLLLGCGGYKDMSPQMAKDKAKKGMDRMAREETRAPAGGKHAKDEGPAGGEVKQEAPRKIIYTGTIELVVEDFEQAEASLRARIREHRGYVAHSEITGESKRKRWGTWTIRIPAASGEEFRDQVARMGVPIRNTLSSEDVTDQYFDTQAAQANLEAREKALRALYDKTIANAKLNDLLEVDRELTRVRGEINILKGRLKRWDKLVAFTTFTVTIQESRDYVPPTAPSFGTTVSNTFSGSLEALVALGKFLVLVAVALAPWLPVLLVVVAAIWLLVRQLRRTSPPRQRQVILAELAPESPPPPPPPPQE